jgi:hypothetical protein
MITKETHSIDWNKTAHSAGVVVIALAQTTWWLTKRIGNVAIAILTILAKVFVALASVWASTTETDRHTSRSGSNEAKDGELGINPEDDTMSYEGPGRIRVDM